MTKGGRNAESHDHCIEKANLHRYHAVRITWLFGVCVYVCVCVCVHVSAYVWSECGVHMSVCMHMSVYVCVCVLKQLH